MCLALLVWLFLVQFWRNTSNIHFPETTGSTDAHNLHYNIIAVNGMHVQANNPIHLLFDTLPRGTHCLHTVFRVWGMCHGTAKIHSNMGHKDFIYWLRTGQTLTPNMWATELQAVGTCWTSPHQSHTHTHTHTLVQSHIMFQECYLESMPCCRCLTEMAAQPFDIGNGSSRLGALLIHAKATSMHCRCQDMLQCVSASTESWHMLMWTDTT